MSKIIYIVVGFSGEYDSYHEWMVHGLSDKAAADEQINALKMEQEMRNSFVQKLNAFKQAWEIQNPYPEYPSHLLRKRPKWPSGLRKEQITPEMRQLRDSVDKHNEKINDEHGALHDIHADAETTACLEFLKLIDAPEKIIEEFNGTPWNFSERHADYCVNELEVD
jgi:hypothetical protein